MPRSQKETEILTGWNPLNSYRVPLNSIFLHSCPSCSLGSFTTQKKSIAELHRLHPQIPSSKTMKLSSKLSSKNHGNKERNLRISLALLLHNTVCPSEWHQHGVSIQSSINLSETVLQITCERRTQTSVLARLFV